MTGMCRGWMLVLSTLGLLAIAVNVTAAEVRRDALGRPQGATTGRVVDLDGDMVDVCATIIPPITEGYGAHGPYRVAVKHTQNPRWNGRLVSVFYPLDAPGPHPVVFFAHGFGAVDYQSYESLIRHIVSRGYVLVYAPYQTIIRQDADASNSTNIYQERYDTLWSGFDAAVATSRDLMDLDRVGFVGHSFGGGAVPAMAYKGLVEQGWGSRGAFMYIMAPWYSFEITPKQLRAYPPHTKLLLQVYADDSTNDHRMAMDLFYSIGVPMAEKDYVILFSQSREGCAFTADHAVPSNHGDPGVLQNYGVFRVFDALAEYAFTESAFAKQVALGHGHPRQRDMGQWPDGIPYRKLISECLPRPIKRQSCYEFPWNAEENERRHVDLIF